jgi:membrane-associated phospholipid phosphatase
MSAHWPSDVLAGYALGLAWTITLLVLGLPWAAGLRQIPGVADPWEPSLGLPC